MKRIYFIRHGQTEGNVDQKDYGREMILTQKGEMQAEAVAERTKTIAFQKLIASDYPRAIQTAEAIQRVHSCALETSPLFGEIHIPTELHGVHFTDERFRDYWVTRNAHFDDPSWRYGDGENLWEVNERVRKGAAYLESLEEEAIIVVTHSFYLKCFMIDRMLGDSINGELWNRMVTRLRPSNISITLYEVEGDVWRLITWNDIAHFAE